MYTSILPMLNLSVMQNIKASPRKNIFIFCITNNISYTIIKYIPILR
jgi:hypothetical protein